MGKAKSQGEAAASVASPHKPPLPGDSNSNRFNILTQIFTNETHESDEYMAEVSG